MCGCECCISIKSMLPSLLSWRERILRKLKYQILYAQNKRSVETVNHLFEAFKSYIVPRVNYMFKIASDMAMAKMCAYPSFKYSLPHWKYVMRCCAKCPCIDLPNPESDQHNPNVSPTRQGLAKDVTF